MTGHQFINRVILLSALVTCSAIASEAVAIPPAYHVTDLGMVAGYGINASGQVTGQSDTHAFLWTPSKPGGTSGTMHDLGTVPGMPGDSSVGYAINDNGQVTGECCIGLGSDGSHAFLYDGTTMHDLGTLGGTYSSGQGINAAGHVTGHSWTSGGSAAVIHAFLYDGTTMHDLGALGDYHSLGIAINDVGQVTGYSYAANFGSAHAFVWTAAMPNGASGTMHDLGTLSGDPSQASIGYAINASGQVTGESEGHAFLWTPTTPNDATGAMLDLGTLGGNWSIGLGVNAGGHVTGWSLTAPDTFVSHAFLYTSQHGMVDLNTLIDPLSGWDLYEGHAINDAGQITGAGFMNGEYHTFLMTPVPESTCATLFALAAVGLVVTFPRRNRTRPLAHRFLIAIFILLPALAEPVRAAMFNANNVAELISAINSANQNTEPDSISLAPRATFTLLIANNSTNGPTGLPKIVAGEPLSIFGNGAVIERTTAISVRLRLFDVAPGASLTLENLTLQHGWAYGTGIEAQGGAILNQGTLILRDVIVQDNLAEGRASTGNQLSGTQPAHKGLGGGIFSNGSLTIGGGMVESNRTIGGRGMQSISARGGGTFISRSGAAALGGGLYVAGGSADIRDVNFIDNSAQGGRGGDGHATHGSFGAANGGGGYGGAIYVLDGTVDLNNLTILSNSVSGGNGGNGGGGAFTGDAGDGGHAFGGALRVVGGTATVRNSTVMENDAHAGDAGVKGPAAGSMEGIPGQGQGGGLHLGVGSVGLDEFSVGHIVSNTASTSDPNISGAYQIISSPPSLPGDFNYDGTVDAADYVVWRKNPGGIYTQNDYYTWRTHFGQTAGSGSGANANAAVPEPATQVMLLTGTLAALFRRRGAAQ